MEYEQLFKKELNPGLLKYGPFDYEIPFKPGTNLRFSKLYGFNAEKLKTFDKYLDENLKKGYI